MVFSGEPKTHAACDNLAQFHCIAAHFCFLICPSWHRRRTTDDGTYICGERIGEVLAATQEAACLRAIHKFKIKNEDRRELEVRRVAASDIT
jgi:hypothetical protein